MSIVTTGMDLAKIILQAARRKGSVPLFLVNSLQHAKQDANGIGEI